MPERIGDNERSVGPAARGLAHDARVQGRAASAAAASRLQRSLDDARAKRIDDLLHRDADVGLGRRDAFPTLGDADRAKFQESAAGVAQLLGPGLPLPPSAQPTGDPDAIRAFLTQLDPASSQRRSPRRPTSPRSLDAGWPTVSKQLETFEPVPEPQRRVRLNALRDASLADTLRALTTLTVGDIDKPGITLPDAWDDKTTSLKRLVSEVIYVGPSFFAVFTVDGKVARGTPVGWSGRALSVSAPKTPTGGTYLAYGLKGPTDRYQKPHVVQLNGELRGGAFGQWGMNVESTFDEERRLREWSQSGLARVFVVSPSYWHRRGIAAAYGKALVRLWRVCEIGIQEGYWIESLKEILSNIKAWDVAKMVFWMLVDSLCPIPSLDDLDDTTRLATCIGMAIWGDERNAEQDCDAAARLLAPEVLSLAIGAAGIAVNLAVLAKHIRKKGKTEVGDPKSHAPVGDTPAPNPSPGATDAPPMKPAPGPTDAPPSKPAGSTSHTPTSKSTVGPTDRQLANAMLVDPNRSAMNDAHFVTDIELKKQLIEIERIAETVQAKQLNDIRAVSANGAGASRMGPTLEGSGPGGMTAGSSGHTARATSTPVMASSPAATSRTPAVQIVRKSMDDDRLQSLARRKASNDEARATVRDIDRGDPRYHDDSAPAHGPSSQSHGLAEEDLAPLQAQRGSVPSRRINPAGEWLQDRSVLRRRLEALLERWPNRPDWLKRKSDWEAHHIFPWEFKDHPVFDVLAKTHEGWDHNGIQNGLPLPTRFAQTMEEQVERGAVHQASPTLNQQLQRHGSTKDISGHPIYNQEVKAELDKLHLHSADLRRQVEDLRLRLIQYIHERHVLF